MADNDPKSAKKGGPGRPFEVGKSGNPGGRPAVPPEVREALVQTTLPRLATLERLTLAAEVAGDIKTASGIHLALLKKTVPDATELTISMPDGLNVRSITIDPRKLIATKIMPEGWQPRWTATTETPMTIAVFTPAPFPRR